MFKLEDDQRKSIKNLLMGFLNTEKIGKKWKRLSPQEIIFKLDHMLKSFFIKWKKFMRRKKESIMIIKLILKLKMKKVK